MSTQNSFRIALLLVLLISLCQLGFSQTSESDVLYAANYSSATSASASTIENSYENVAPETMFYDFSKAATLPRFDQLETYVTEHLVYPSLAQTNAIEGSVVLSLKLSATGEVNSAIVVQSLGYGCDEAALSLVMGMPNWVAASNYGVAVGSKQLITIDFRLR